MKTLFQMGLLTQNYWMGQAAIPTSTTYNAPDLVAKMSAAHRQYVSAVAIKNTPNYQTLLGVDAQRFDQMMGRLAPIESAVVAAYVQADPITQAQAEQMQDFIAVSAELAKIVQAHPMLPAAALQTTAIAPGVSPMNPLVIGGVAAGALLIGILIFS